MHNSFIARSTESPNHSIAEGSCNCSPLAITIGNTGSAKKHLINHQTAFNIHNSLPHHRDPSACGFLLTS
jgi:hypothetical protein